MESVCLVLKKDTKLSKCVSEELFNEQDTNAEGDGRRQRVL